VTKPKHVMRKVYYRYYRYSSYSLF